MVEFKMYDVADWTTNSCDTQITKYLKKLRQSGGEIGQLIKYSVINISL